MPPFYCSIWSKMNQNNSTETISGPDLWQIGDQTQQCWCSRLKIEFPYAIDLEDHPNPILVMWPLPSINVANKMKRKIELSFITDLHVIVWRFMYFFSLVGFFPKTNMFILSFICPPRLVMYMDIRLDFHKLHTCAVVVWLQI